jgi:hypothetical protein
MENARAAAASRLKAWTRERFRLPAEATIVVMQGRPDQPGFPPHETHVLFWIAEQRHHFRVFKPLAEVSPDDLPPAWLRDALAAGDGLDCGCC